MKLADFNYCLPKELIAQYPLKERDAGRLLVLHRKEQKIEHRLFKEITHYFRKKDLLVLNDTKVLKSRLSGRRPSGGRVEVLLLARKSGSVFRALISPGRLRIGEKLILGGNGSYAVISAKDELTFAQENIEDIYKSGLMPLPPYIKREPEELDNIYYQTVYARNEGAVAAPTAGLHFTEGLLAKIKEGGINLAYLTLHVGIGTFKPVKTEDITKHKMEPEYFRIPEEAVRLIEDTRGCGGRIIAVGTTGLRALESFAAGRREGNTGLFIYPGYEFKLADALLTNFHLPATTLFMLVCAFAGEKFIKQAYKEAIEKKYRFYSYGDAMLII